jgi:hypothetical protein
MSALHPSPFTVHASRSAQVLVHPRAFLGRPGTLRLLALATRCGREIVSTRRGNVALVVRHA